jgi:hypothetical protein
VVKQIKIVRLQWVVPQKDKKWEVIVQQEATNRKKHPVGGKEPKHPHPMTFPNLKKRRKKGGMGKRKKAKGKVPSRR